MHDHRPHFLTTKDIAARLAISKRTVRNWVKHGVRPRDALANVRLRATRFGQCWRVRTDDLAAFESALGEHG